VFRVFLGLDALKQGFIKLWYACHQW